MNSFDENGGRNVRQKDVNGVAAIAGDHSSDPVFCSQRGSPRKQRCPNTDSGLISQPKQREQAVGTTYCAE